MSRSHLPAPVVEEDLHAFVDHALEAGRRQEVQEFLDRNPDAAEAVADLSAQRQFLRSGLAHIAGEPVPERLKLSTLVASRRTSNPWAWQMAAALVLSLGMGGFGGWQMHVAIGQPSSGITALAGEARTSYAVYAAEEVVDPGKVELVSMISSKLKQPIAIPDLGQSGYHYVGGRLVATGHGPAGLFFYDRADGTRMAVMVRPMVTDQEAPMMEQSVGPVAGFTWAQRGLGYSVVGIESPESLHPVADEVRRQARGRQDT